MLIRSTCSGIELMPVALWGHNWCVGMGLWEGLFISDG
jgi:hypothetical protein